MTGKYAQNVQQQQHLEECAAYAHLRTNRDIELNFTDKIHYFMDVTAERMRRK